MIRKWVGGPHPRQWTWGNATIAARTYDLDGNVGQIDAGGEFYQYALDDAFRITGITNTSNAALSWNYGYDNRDRLTSASSVPRAESWTYDANGNRLTQAGALGSGTYSNTITVAPSSNRITAITGSRANNYSYDNAGNITAETNAQRPVAQAGTTVTAFVYNALSQRVSKSSALGTVRFVYDEAGHLLGEYASNGSLVQELVWLGDIPVAALRPASGGGVTVYYIHTDHLNTPRKVTRPADNGLMWRWDPTPFGDVLADENPAGQGVFQFNLRYPGQYWDRESGLHYNYFRDYDPATGRYIESDPIGLEGGINTYGYVGGNPLSNIDPEGLASPGRTRPGTGFPGLGVPGPFSDSWNKARDAAALKLEEWLNRAVSTVKNWCSSEEQEEDKNCEALYQSTLQTCASLKGRKRFACFEAARENREQCYREKGKVAPFSPLETEPSPVFPWMRLGGAL